MVKGLSFSYLFREREGTGKNLVLGDYPPVVVGLIVDRVLVVLLRHVASLVLVRQIVGLILVILEH